MLIEGALRFGRRAEEALHRGDQTAAAGPLLRTIDIVGELLAGVREKKSDLNKKLTDLYWFLFRRVSQAKIGGDAAALAEALRLLEFERQTWQMACDKAAAAEASPPPAPHAQTFGSGRGKSTAAGLSLEA
jgi:flagellar protein FliS